MKKTSIIILNYNSWQNTIEEIETLHTVVGVDYKDIIVVDNCSNNNSVEELKKLSYVGFVLLESKENKGYAYGNNIGMRWAREQGYKNSLIINNDIIIEDANMLKKLERVLEIDNTVAVVNPDIFNPEGYMFNRDSKKMSFWDFTLGMFSYRKKGRILQDIGGYGYVYRPQGCCMLVDLIKLERVGFMDEYTFLYFEEPILAERLRTLNYKCACCVETKVIHNHSQTVKNNIEKKKINEIKIDSFRYYLKEYRNYNNIKINTCIFMYKIKNKLLGE